MAAKITALPSGFTVDQKILPALHTAVSLAVTPSLFAFDDRPAQTARYGNRRTAPDRARGQCPNQRILSKQPFADRSPAHETHHRLTDPFSSLSGIC